MKPTRPPAPCRGYKLKGGREYWEVQRAIAARGYRPTTFRLHFPDTPAGRLACAARCEDLTGQAEVWAANGGAFPRRTYDGTVASIAALYQVDEYSPFRRRYSEFSRGKIAHDLKMVVDTVGARRVASLRGEDFARWEDQAGKPKEPGGPPRLWRARNFMVAVRRIISYGKSCGHPDCKAAKDILDEMNFSTPGTRKQRLDADHLVAIRATAHRLGLHSVALACTIQFETGLRQVDVVGRWFNDPDAAGGIEFNGRRWGKGLTWDMLDASLVLRKVTSKRGVPVQHPLQASPELLAELDRVPAERRVGPVIISERTGEPYKHGAFCAAFRRVRAAAGLPSDLQNRDARSGAITESLSAGARLEDVAKLAGHKDVRITMRYDKGGPERSGRVLELRQVKRRLNKG